MATSRIWLKREFAHRQPADGKQAEDDQDQAQDAGQYGAVDQLERRYAQERQWMQANYPKVRKYVVAYLRFDALDAEHCSTLDGSFGDAFEALFAAPSVDCFMTMDDGHMISRILRTREALNLYGEHLRQLLARDASCE